MTPFGPLRLVIALAACVAGGAAVIAQAGRFSGLADLPAHLAPVWLVMGALATMLELLGARRRAVLAAGAVAVLAAAVLIAPEYLRPLPPRSEAGRGPVLTLVQLNALDTNLAHGQVVDWIVAQRPDVVMIEEATPKLRDALVGRTGWAVVGRRTSVMIFSPHPLTGVGVRPSVSSAGAPTWVNAVMSGPWGETPLLAVHAYWPTRDPKDRIGAVLAQVVAAIGRDDLVMAGDFNSTPWSFTRQRHDRLFGLARVTRGMFSFPAWLGPLAAMPIDQVYLGRRWRLVSLERGPNLGSDHFPLVAKLAPAGGV